MTPAPTSLATCEGRGENKTQEVTPMQSNYYSIITNYFKKLINNDAVAEKAAALWIEHGNHDSYSRNYLILFGKWAQRELTVKNPEIGAVELQEIDIVDDYEIKVINKIARTEKLNEIKQFGAWAVTAVKLMEAGFSFGGISRKLKIPKTELIQRLTALADGKGQLAIEFSVCGGER